MTEVREKINNLNIENTNFEEYFKIDRKKLELLVNKIFLPITDSGFFPVL